MTNESTEIKLGRTLLRRNIQSLLQQQALLEKGSRTGFELQLANVNNNTTCVHVRIQTGRFTFTVLCAHAQLAEPATSEKAPLPKAFTPGRHSSFACCHITHGSYNHNNLRVGWANV